MSCKRLIGMNLLSFSVVCFSMFAHGQAAQLPERPADHVHGHAHASNLNVPSGVTDKCGPTFTYDDGPRGPSHWEGLCTTSHMQTPIDITQTEKIAFPLLPQLQFNYQPAELDIVNDCNNYQLKARFPVNKWLKYRRKPYRLSEIRFHEPGENAVNGKRPPMSLQLLHLSPEATLLIIEVPVVVGKENPVIKTLWDHIPQGGKENQAANIKIDAMGLLPADHGYYRFPGSMTAPICNEGVQWFLMKNPIEMSADQIAKYKRYYHNTARPLQPSNSRPVDESK